MKILHTADWHIGKSIYKQSLRDEMSLFFDWMLELIRKEDIELILIAGDIFDLANSSNIDKTTYYNILEQLSNLGVKVVIIAGNHDSPSLLEAPAGLLKKNGIFIVGDASDIDKQYIRYENSLGEIVQILAVPFLREGDVRQSVSGESREDRIVSLQKGINTHYQKLYEIANTNDSDNPILAMGHLYMQGAKISDSERDIQIGNLAGINVNTFVEQFDYVALGHIHRPQKLNQAGNIRYSGSPIPLSFSEYKDVKQVIILEISDQEIKEIKPIEVPIFRSLVRLKGTTTEILSSLENYKKLAELESYIEIDVVELKSDPAKVTLVQNIPAETDEYIIISRKINFADHTIGLMAEGLNEHIEDYKERDVFLKRIANEDLIETDRKEILAAFDHIIEIVGQEG